MMKILVVLALWVMSPILSADSITSYIHSVVPASQGDETLIRLTNGRVVFMKKADKAYSQEISRYAGEVRIITDVDNNFISAIALSDTPVEKFFSYSVEDGLENLEPTVIQGKAQAEKIFKRMNHKYQRVSQCFNRAHIWANDEYINNKLVSLKGFIFFTNSYITRHRFLWWFHVAPMFVVSEGGNKKNMVMDHRYSSRPQTMDEWKNMFVFTKRACKQGRYFLEYLNGADQNEDCYWVTAPMYFWQPMDIKMDEMGTLTKRDFLLGEITTARSEAF